MQSQIQCTGKRPVRKRAKGSGTLVLRGGKWQARWKVNGKVYVRSTGTGSRREAERRLLEYTADFRSRDERHIVECLAARVRGLGAEIERLADERAALPLAAAFEAYRRLQSRPDTGPRTMEMYASQWWRLLGWLKENRPEVKTIQQVTRPVEEAFAEYVAQNFSAGTFNKYRAFMRCLWSALAETARLKSNPWDAIRRKRQTPHVRRALDGMTREQLLAARAEIDRRLAATEGNAAEKTPQGVDGSLSNMIIYPRNRKQAKEKRRWRKKSRMRGRRSRRGERK